jgi:PAS domain-containing protein
VVKLLTNPLALRSIVVLVLAMGGFALGIWVMRRLRRTIAAEAELDTTTAPSLETLPLHLYNTVIQQLKQQKRDLEVQSQTEQRRARTTENFSQAVLSNLSCGVLVFGTNGLVKQSNPAAKDILGFASPFGMSAEDILRGAVVSGSNVPSGGTSPARLADEVHCVLRGDSKRRQAEADYTTPVGTKRRIALTISPVPAVDGALLGAACLINDLSEFERIRRQQELHGEISAEMALELRTSLATISGYAQQLANSRDPQLAKQLAADIADEAAHLDRNIGGFLTEKRTLKNAASASAQG